MEVYSAFRHLEKKNELNTIIYKERIQSAIRAINSQISSETYKEIGLAFDYDDIKYLIVPTDKARDRLIIHIKNLKKALFKQGQDIQTAKMNLASKILVLNEVEKDW